MFNTVFFAIAFLSIPWLTEVYYLMVFLRNAHECWIPVGHVCWEICTLNLYSFSGYDHYWVTTFFPWESVDIFLCLLVLIYGYPQNSLLLLFNKFPISFSSLSTCVSIQWKFTLSVGLILCRYFCTCMLSVLLDIFEGVKLLCYIIISYLSSEDFPDYFPI